MQLESEPGVEPVLSIMESWRKHFFLSPSVRFFRFQEKQTSTRLYSSLPLLCFWLRRISSLACGHSNISLYFLCPTYRFWHRLLQGLSWTSWGAHSLDPHETNWCPRQVILKCNNKDNVRGFTWILDLGSILTVTLTLTFSKLYHIHNV